MKSVPCTTGVFIVQLWFSCTTGGTGTFNSGDPFTHTYARTLTYIPVNLLSVSDGRTTTQIIDYDVRRLLWSYYYYILLNLSLFFKLPGTLMARCLSGYIVPYYMIVVCTSTLQQSTKYSVHKPVQHNCKSYAGIPFKYYIHA